MTMMKMKMKLMLMLLVGVLFSQCSGSESGGGGGARPEKFKGFVGVSMDVVASENAEPQKMQIAMRMAIDDARLVLDSFSANGDFIQPEQAEVIKTAKIVLDTTTGMAMGGIMEPNKKEKVGGSLELRHALQYILSTKAVQDGMEQSLAEIKKSQNKEEMKKVLKQYNLNISKGKDQVIDGRKCQLIVFKTNVVDFEIYFTREIYLNMDNFQGMVSPFMELSKKLGNDNDRAFYDLVKEMYSIDLEKEMENAAPVKIVLKASDKQSIQKLFMESIAAGRETPTSAKEKLQVTMNFTYNNVKTFNPKLFTFDDYIMATVPKSKVEEFLGAALNQ